MMFAGFCIWGRRVEECGVQFGVVFFVDPVREENFGGNVFVGKIDITKKI
jgi:hypothetical protein